jgi:acyl-CoA synthetase (NDP forming)
MFNSVDSLAPFFSPRGVAVVGASSDPYKLGYGLARNLVQCNYQGAIHFVNPKGGSLLGRAMFPSVTDLPDPVDLAIILIPAPGVANVLKERVRCAWYPRCNCRFRRLSRDRDRGCKNGS